MTESRRYTVYPSDLDLVLAFEKLRSQFGKKKLAEAKQACRDTRFRVQLNRNREQHADTFSELLELLRENQRPRCVDMHCHWTDGKRDVPLSIWVSQSAIDVKVTGDSDTIAVTQELVRDVFQACDPAPERSPSLSRYDLKKSVFLAHRFDHEGVAAARPLTTFLTRLGFQVVQGEGYEARDIPEKVADRIRSQDIFILLVTPGDASWITGEAAFAKALSKYLVLVVQDGSDFKKGIVGSDYEHIPFAQGSIEKAFNDLLYALPN